MKRKQYGSEFEGKMKGFPKWRLAVIAAMMIFATTSLSGCGEYGMEQINWSDIELGNRLPTPPSDRGHVFVNSDEELDVKLKKVKDAQYNDYYDACVEKGYNIDGNKTSTSYKAYDAEGYCLNLSFSGDSLTIELTTPKEFSEIEWPNSTAGNLLPIPKSSMGNFSFEHENRFHLELGNTSKEDYNEYVKACSERGFTVDYNKGDDFYYADNADGWHLSLNYEGNNIMSIEIIEPDKNVETTAPETVAPETSSPETDAPETDAPETATPETDAPETDAPETTTASASNESGLSPEFKEAMDSYETFMNEYVDFMKKYEDNSSDLGFLISYADYMSKYAKFVEDFESWEDDEMNAEETAYYIDVQARVSKKLLEIDQ